MDKLLIKMPPDQPIVDALEDLVLDGDLDKLESLTSSFNIFEAIGAVRRELRHSDFLSFLLNPSESHGLYDAFLKSFLFGITKANRSVTPISPVDIDLLDLSDAEVRREWENIDILLVSNKSKFVCAIENKLDSTEHSNQLARYQSKVESEFREFNKLFVYLTIEGDGPERDLDWLPYSYRDLHGVVSTILKESRSRIGEDINTLLTHYVDMIDRHFMNENELADLSRRIYQRHKKALDLIFEHRPDALMETNKYILDVINSYMSEKLEMDHSTKGYIRFAIKRWDQVEGQLSGDGQWTKSNRVILFEIHNITDEIAFKLLIGPGDSDFREKVFKAVENDPKIFKGRSKSLYGKWTQIYKKRLVSKIQMEYELESIKSLIEQELQKILFHGELDKICDFMDTLFEIPDD